MSQSTDLSPTAASFTAMEQRVAAVACGAVMATLVPVLLFQTGVTRRLPDPPGSIFDSETITSSGAGHPFGIPDAAPGIAAYGLALTLILRGRRGPADRRRMAACVAMLGGVVAFNMGRQVVQFRRLCSWCTGSAAATGVMVWAARHAMREAVRSLIQ